MNLHSSWDKVADLLGIHGWTSLVSIIGIALVFLALFLFKKKYGYNKTMYLSIITAVIVGIIFLGVNKWESISGTSSSFQKDTAGWLSSIGQLFINLMMAVLPFMMFFTIGSSVMKFSAKGTGKGFFAYAILYLAAILVAILIALIILLTPATAKHTSGSGFSMWSYHTLITTINQYIPRPANLFQKNTEVFFMTGSVVFGLMVGIAYKKMKSRNKFTKLEEDVFFSFMHASKNVMHSIMMYVLKLLPYSVFGMTVASIMSQGAESFSSAGWFLLLNVLAIGSVLFLIVMYVKIRLRSKFNIKNYFKNFGPVAVSAFGSRSSLASAPAAIEVLVNKYHVDREKATLLQTMTASTMLLTCTTVFPVISTIAIAHWSSYPVDMSLIIVMIITVIVTGLGISGAPGSGGAAVNNVAGGVLPKESFDGYVSIVWAMGPLIDMFRTVVNVLGPTLISILYYSKHDESDKPKE